MSDPDGAVGLVDVLPSRAAGPVGVDAEILLVDLDLPRLDLRNDVDGGEGGVSAVGLVEGRVAHEAVDADLAAGA